MMVCASVDEMENYVETYVHDLFCLLCETVDAYRCKTAK